MDVLWKNLVYSARMLLKKPSLTTLQGTGTITTEGNEPERLLGAAVSADRQAN